MILKDRDAIKKILTNRSHPNSGFYLKQDSTDVTWDKNDITLTVALPIFNGKKISTLAFESLFNQKDIDFSWELIIMEENGLSKRKLNSYQEKFPNCKRVKYIPLKEKMMLLDKWSAMAKMSSLTSNVFVLQSADCYSPPRRLKVHHEIHRLRNCIWSHQNLGVFLNF